jgi:sugar O-acyltransferase (sialic acid O-acetyltransferase NeuD family)
MTDVYGLIGAGGFGREVMPLVQAQFAEQISDGSAEVCFVVEDDEAAGTVNGVPLLSMTAFSQRSGRLHFNVAIADSKARARIAGHCEELGMRPFSILAENSINLSSNNIGPGLIFCHYAMVTSNASIGRFFHCNLYSYVAHDCVIGDFVTFAPGVKCNGRVFIEDHAYIGTGAILRPGTHDAPFVIGRGAVVGMGAVVTRSVPAGATVFGNPARVLAQR